MISHYNSSSAKNDPISFDHYRLLLGVKNINPYQKSTFCKFNSNLIIQASLLMAGFNPGGLDGNFGPKSQAALRQFQSYNGLRPDGDFGPRSAFMLDISFKEKSFLI